MFKTIKNRVNIQMQLHIHTEFGCLALIAVIYFSLSGLERVYKLFRHKHIDPTKDTPLPQWIRHISAVQMSGMRSMVLFLIPINILTMLEMQAYSFLSSLTTHLAIGFTTVFILFYLAIVLNKTSIAHGLQFIMGCITWGLYLLLGTIYFTF